MMLWVAEKQAYFLFGGFAVSFLNGFEFEKADDMRICTTDFDNFQHGGQILMNNWLAIWGGLTVSPDIENKFEI